MDPLQLLLLLAPIMVIHELGHAVAAELFFGRGSVGRFSLGLPPVALHLFRLGKIDFVIGKLPLGASTGIHRSAHERASKKARLAVALAGTAANAVSFALFPNTMFGLLSLAMGLFQLLPLPGGLDGGHLIVDLLEFRGKRRDAWERRGRRVTIAGCVLIIVLSLLVGISA